ncbi:MAG: hypothetical protein JSR37_07940 [Verrucomicrobia bacterium]|nr:hypothetical protein [Verrucomicrobiota bacterium]MBS0637463.1 hypothetical protein [Verrucomicrobiota bacterium]
MKIATILFCLAVTTAHAGISNQQPTHVHIKAKSAAKHVSSKKFSSVSSEDSSSSSSSSSSSASISAQPSIAPEPVKPAPTITQLVIKNARPAKKSHSTQSKNMKRGRRGPQGKKGKRGKRGKKGCPGQPGISALSSATTTTSATLAAGELIKNFTVTAANSITYTSSTGIFSSESGPGLYEINYGANWIGSGVITLLVDGVAQPSTASSTWARESLIVTSTAQSPTFALGNSATATDPVTYTNAFITIKKIN